MISAESIEAKYGKTGVPPGPMQDLYAPGMSSAPNKQGQIPQGSPIPEGGYVQQVVGRGMAVVPPTEPGHQEPQIRAIPPQGTTRTTIGTIVEPSQTNPLTAKPEPVTQVEQQPEQQRERKPLDLAKEILTHIWELGGEKSEAAQKFYDRSPQTIKQWYANPGNIPLSAINKFLQRSPGIKEEVLELLEPHFSANGQEITSLPTRTKLDLMICSPILERPTLPFTTALGYLLKKYECGFTFQADTMIVRSRNMLADRFLKSGCQWSLWIDGDMAPPIANPDWYRWITGSTSVPDEYCAYDVLGRLLSHNKPIVGGVYASRRWHGALVIQPEINPRSHEDKLLCNDLRRGTARGLVAVEWIGFGAALIHREVFLEIQRRYPQLAPTTEFGAWRYFQPEGDEGEDEAFCKRARSAQIPIWLDTQLVCGHIGNMAFLPEHTQHVMAI
jgi:hypothetical protein